MSSAADKEAFILATASGGKALRAFNAGTSRAVPGVHVLLPPRNVAIRGPLDPQRTEELAFSSSEEHSLFCEKVGTQGWAAALNANVNWRLGHVNIQATYNSDMSSQQQSWLQSKTQSVIVTQCMYVPMKSFQIPRSQMILTPEVVADALKVTTDEQAKAFLEKYNSHVYSGLYHVGGVFMRETSVTSSEQVSKACLTQKALEKLGVCVEVSYSSPFVSASGNARVSYSESSYSNSEESRDVKYSASAEKTQVWGATTAGDKEEFIEKLEEDPSKWAIVDNAVDQPQDMVGIWEIMSACEELKEPAKLICKCWQGLVKTAAEKDPWLKGLLTQSYGTTSTQGKD